MLVECWCREVNYLIMYNTNKYYNYITLTCQGS